MVRHILVPHDGSEQSDDALVYTLETFPDATVTVFRSVEPFAEYTGAGGYAANYSEEVVENVRESLSDTITALIDDAQIDRDPDDVEREVSYGRPIHEILEYVDENDVDQIVMGSHGRDGAARLLLGSVAETVVRRSPVPVTVVRADGAAVDSVLVPYDASSQSRRALEHALAQFPDASVTALYVVHPTVEQLESGDESDEASVWNEGFEEHIEQTLDSASSIAADHDRVIETESTGGKPSQSIVEYVEEHDSDHVVMGSSGRDGLARLLLGSVAETVVRRSPVSVTVVR
jgi:nucleotide-binding universal stress UspA family protein